MEAQESSDPLPFTQVDRAVKPKAALLAASMGTSIQHVMGSLIEFWDLCGDPRDLERLVREGKDEVVLSANEVAGRFALASGGATVEPSVLASLGLLEPRGDAFRVRGMSRYFRPIQRRVHARDAGRQGGLATAAKAHRIGGKFAKTPPEQPSEPAGEVPEVPLQHPLQQPPSDPPSTHQAKHQATAERETEQEPAKRTEVIGHRSSQEEEAPPPPKESDPGLSGGGFFAWVQVQRRQHGLVGEEPPDVRKLSAWFSVAMMETNGDVERLKAAYARFTDSQYWAKAKWPFQAFISQWREHVPDAKPRRIA